MSAVYIEISISYNPTLTTINLKIKAGNLVEPV